MRQFIRQFDLRRCARGIISDQGEATNTTLALTNNSNASELILVHANAGDGLNQQPNFLAYRQGLTLTPGGNITAIVPGDAPPPGVLSSGDLLEPITPDWPNPTLTFTTPGFMVFPYAVLLPGWALVFQQVANYNGPLGVSIFWE